MTGTQAAEAPETVIPPAMVEGSDEHKQILWEDLGKPGQPFGKEADGSTETTEATEDKPAGQEKTGAETETAKAAATAEEPKRPDDVPEADWNAASPSLRKVIIDRGNEIERVRQFERNAGTKTIKGLTRKVAELSRKPATAKAEEEAPEVTALKKEYPDVAGPVSKMIETATAPLKAELDVFREGAQAEDLSTQDQIIHDLHPDYDGIRASKAFSEWFVQNQHVPFIREAVERNAEVVVDAHEVGKLVSLFKAETGFAPKPAAASAAASETKTLSTTETKRQLQAKAAAGSSTRVAPAGPALAPENDPQALWDEAGTVLDRKMGRRK